jgi:hypothetical protein
MFYNPESYGIITVAIATPVFMLILVPIILLSMKTPLNNTDDIEDEDVVLKKLRKKMGQGKQPKTSFSALSLPTLGRLAKGSVLHFDDASDKVEVYSQDRSIKAFTEENKPATFSFQHIDSSRIITKSIPSRLEVSLEMLEISKDNEERSPLSSKFSSSPISPIKGISSQNGLQSPSRQQIYKFFSNSPRSSGLPKLGKISSRPRRYRHEFPGKRGYLSEDVLWRDKVKNITDLRIKPKQRRNGKFVSPSYDKGPGFTSIRTVDYAQSENRVIFTYDSLTGDGLRHRSRKLNGDNSNMSPGSRLESDIRETERYVWSRIDSTAAVEPEDTLSNTFFRQRNRKQDKSDDIFDEKLPLFY